MRVKIKEVLRNRAVQFVLAVLVVLAVYTVFLGFRNRKYTKNLPDYPMFYYNDGLNYYTERTDEMTIELVRLFDIFHPTLGVQLTLNDVYWEDVDDYVYITLAVKESLTGKTVYSIAYQSKPVIKELPYREVPGDVYGEGALSGVSASKYSGRFLVDENMNSLYDTGIAEDKENQEYKDFVRQNEAGLTELVRLANEYWNLGLAYHPD